MFYFSDSSAMRIVGMVAVVLVALVAINAGLSLWEYDFFKSGLMTGRLAWANRPLHILVGLAGLFILFAFIMSLMNPKRRP